MNLIPKDLIATFRAAISTDKLLKKLLCNFIYNLVHYLHYDIVCTDIWKYHCELFSEWKQRNNINKNSFKKFRARKNNKKIASRFDRFKHLRPKKTRIENVTIIFIVTLTILNVKIRMTLCGYILLALIFYIMCLG